MVKGDYLSYDENVDHLTIYKSKEEIASSVDTGLIIFSLNKKKLRVAMEIIRLLLPVVCFRTTVVKMYAI